MPRASWLVLSTTVLVSFAVPSRAQAQDELTKFRNRETAVWESVKSKDVDGLRKVMDRDFVSVYDSGISTTDQELDAIGKLTMRSFQISDFAVHHVDALNVIVTYKVVVDSDMQGQSLSGTYNALTAWHRTGNRWWVSAHTEVKAK